MTAATGAAPMHRADEVTGAIAEQGIVAVLRFKRAALIAPVAEALVDAGIRAIEVTLTTPGALTAISELRERLPSSVIIGAGSVSNPEQVGQCAAVGARFAMTPNLDRDTVRAAGEHDLPLYPGILTPSEAVAASAMGVPAIKLFPASTVGPDYLRTVRAPLPDLRVIPTGGIRIDDVETWVRHGAIAVGLGAPLIGDAGTSGPDALLAERARAALAGVKAGRSGQ